MKPHEAIPVMLRELGDCLALVKPSSVEQALAELASARRIYSAGAGRSGLAIRAFAMRLMHMGKAAYVVGEIATPAIAKGDLLVIGSGSGRTESLVVMANKAKQLGARIVLVTIDPTSPIGKMADCVIQIPAPSPKVPKAQGANSIQPLGSLFEQSLFIVLDALIVLLMRREKISFDAMYARHANLE